MAVLMTPPYVRFFDNSSPSLPLAGGKIYTYAAGTTTPKATYTDYTENTQNANPVILDADGVASIWLNGSYKFVIQDSLGNPIKTVDNISAFATAAAGGLTTEAVLASATTTDLGTASSNIIDITGTTAITSFGSSASTSSPLYFLRFSGALTLTYDATALILPSAANITTASGDTCVALYLGSGNWKVLSYSTANGHALVPGIVTVKTQEFSAGSTYTPSAGMVYCKCRLKGGGGGGGGVSSGNGNAGAGGGEGGYAEKIFPAATIGSSQTVTIGAGGAAGANTGGQGGTGGTTSLGSLLSATGGVGGNGATTAPVAIAGGAGGTGSSGDLNLTGAAGGAGLSTATGAYQRAISGFGGGIGGGVARAGNTTIGAGNSGANGGGGSGALSDGTAAYAGGAGGAGYVIIDEYCSQ